MGRGGGREEKVVRGASLRWSSAGRYQPVRLQLASSVEMTINVVVVVEEEWCIDSVAGSSFVIHRKERKNKNKRGE